MPNRKRNLEKVERVVYSVTTDAPTEERGAAAKYLRDLIGQAARGELRGVKAAPEEKKSEAQLEFESVIARIANKLRAPANRAEGKRKEEPSRSPDELPEDLRLRLRKGKAVH